MYENSLSIIHVFLTVSSMVKQVGKKEGEPQSNELSSLKITSKWSSGDTEKNHNQVNADIYN